MWVMVVVRRKRRFPQVSHLRLRKKEFVVAVVALILSSVSPKGGVANWALYHLLISFFSLLASQFTGLPQLGQIETAITKFVSSIKALRQLLQVVVNLIFPLLASAAKPVLPPVNNVWAEKLAIAASRKFTAVNITTPFAFHCFHSALLSGKRHKRQSCVLSPSRCVCDW